MAAPTNTALVKKALANSEPSTHGPSATSLDVRGLVAIGGKADKGRVEMWRGGCRLNMSVAASFDWRCFSGSTMAPFPHPPGHRRRSPASGSHRT